MLPVVPYDASMTEEPELPACGPAPPNNRHLTCRHCFPLFSSSLPAISNSAVCAVQPLLLGDQQETLLPIFALWPRRISVKMKVSSFFLSLLTAASTASAISLFGGEQNALVDEEKFEVPGKNPLTVRAS